jgi:hypothetical protein
MKKSIILLFSITLLSCNCKKSTTSMSKYTTATIESPCPKDGDCTIEVLENKVLNIKKDDLGGIYYTIDEDFNHKVIKYSYNRKVKGDIQDAIYRENIIFELANESKEKIYENEKLQDVKMLFGRFCYCKGAAGNFEVNEGKLEILENKIHLNFKITRVPQVITSFVLLCADCD